MVLDITKINNYQSKLHCLILDFINPTVELIFCHVSHVQTIGYLQILQI